MDKNLEMINFYKAKASLNIAHNAVPKDKIEIQKLFLLCLL